MGGLRGAVGVQRRRGSARRDVPGGGRGAGVPSRHPLRARGRGGSGGGGVHREEGRWRHAPSRTLGTPPPGPPAAAGSRCPRAPRVAHGLSRLRPRVSLSSQSFPSPRTPLNSFQTTPPSVLHLAREPPSPAVAAGTVPLPPRTPGPLTWPRTPVPPPPQARAPVLARPGLAGLAVAEAAGSRPPSHAGRTKEKPGRAAALCRQVSPNVRGCGVRGPAPPSPRGFCAKVAPRTPSRQDGGPRVRQGGRLVVRVPETLPLFGTKEKCKLSIRLTTGITRRVLLRAARPPMASDPAAPGPPETPACPPSGRQRRPLGKLIP